MRNGKSRNRGGLASRRNATTEGGETRSTEEDRRGGAVATKVAGYRTCREREASTRLPKRTTLIRKSENKGVGGTIACKAVLQG